MLRLKNKLILEKIKKDGNLIYSNYFLKQNI